MKFVLQKCSLDTTNVWYTNPLYNGERLRRHDSELRPIHSRRDPRRRRVLFVGVAPPPDLAGGDAADEHDEDAPHDTAHGKLL